MADRHAIKKFDPKANQEIKNTWWKIPGGVAIKCPSCGKIGVINHKVDSSGEVNPSLSCPTEGCGFHEFVKLEGWEE